MGDIGILAVVFGFALTLVIAATVALVRSGRTVPFPPEAQRGGVH